MSTNSLTLRIQEDMKDAMRAKDKLRLSTIRMLIAGIKQREIDERITLDESGVIGIINKQIKQRKESVKQFEAANRQELADKEKQEIDILQVYLPQQLSESEVDKLIESAISDTGARSIKDMGKLMGKLKSELQGRADMSVVSEKIKAKLS